MSSTEKLTRHALLPESLEVLTVQGMSVGDTVAASCQAMKVDSSRRLWLHPNFSVYDNPEEGRTLVISRTESGYEVDVKLVKNPEWEPEDSFDRYEVVEEEWIPVSRLVF